MSAAVPNPGRGASGRAARAIPPCDREFRQVRRYWDPTRRQVVAKILPGEFYVTTDHELISTTLGSCVAACVRDPVFGIAGMNHFMLPVNRGARDEVDSAIYGSFAMEVLINGLLRRGAERARLEFKLFGGGQVLAGVTDVGRTNIEFVRHYMQTEQFPVLAEDLGGRWPRKLMFDPLSGRVQVKKLTKLNNHTIEQREDEYRHEIEVHAPAGDIELFD